MQVSQYLIYALVEADIYYYVGQSTQYLARPYQHLIHSHNEGINKLRETKQLEVVILEEISEYDKSSLNSRERWWIDFLWAQGHPLENKEVKGIRPKAISIKKNKAPSGSIGRICAELRVKAQFNQNYAAERIGVGLRFLKELEAGKPTCRADKIEQVLNFYGYTLTAKPMEVDYEA